MLEGAFTTVGVVGTGALGIQMTSLLLSKGKNVILKTRDIQLETGIRAGVRKRLEKLQGGASCPSIEERLSIVDDYDTMSSCGIVIEAAKEDLQIKRSIFLELSKRLAVGVPIMSNSSSLSIDSISQEAQDASRCIGFHMFNPVDRMDLVEVVIGKKTSQATVARAASFAREIGKLPITTVNSPGFVVNRLLFVQINEAISMMEEGIASKEDIDQAMKLGLKHPMGPFELADYIGLDICHAILSTIYLELDDEKYRPARTLTGLVSTGKYGRKSGEGFYQYQMAKQTVLAASLPLERPC